MSIDAESRFDAYDGRDISPFREVAERLPVELRSWAALVEWAGDPQIGRQVGATWVIKHWIERGETPPAGSMEQLLELVGHFDDPNATLHCLQVVDSVPLSVAAAQRLFEVVSDLCETSHKFVRAWAYSALAAIAAQHPEHRDQVRELLDGVGPSDPASIRARLRQLSREYAWLAPGD